MKRMWKIVGIIAFVLFVFVSPASGRTITVGTGLGYDYSTIQAAIDAANEGDTVVVAQGTYEQPVCFNGTNIVLTSTDPNDWSIVGHTVIENRDGSVVTFTGTEDESCMLQGFKISRGRGNRRGGGIFGGGTRATIRRCYIENNRASVGAGLYNCDGLIEDCTIEDNTDGGGLYGCDGVISNCTIEDNKAGDDKFPNIGNPGGGLHSCNGRIIGCRIENNHATGKGGGLYGCNGSIINCTISYNTSEDSGGGLSNCMGSIENCTIQSNTSPYWHGGGALNCNLFKDCTIIGNTTRGYGGGLHNCKKVIGCFVTGNTTEIYPGGGLSFCNSVANCVISGNVSGSSGGGLHNCKEVVNCTIVGNYSLERGGAIYYRDNYGIINNTIIWDNLSVDIGQVLVECDEPNSAVCNLLVDYSNVQRGLDSIIVAEGCFLRWEPNNINVDPLFVRPGSWTDENFWLEGDYHLLAGSPCIDAGDPNKDYTGQTDIDGQERVFGQYVDIGADEYLSESPTIYHVDTITGSDENNGLSRQTAFKAIQKGINAAQDGETVLVYPGIYRELILFRGKAITLKSAEGAAVIENPGNFAVLFCFGEGRESVIQNFVIRNCLTGIFVVGSSPTIKNLTVVNNDYGIECYNGNPNISNCILWGNFDTDLIGCSATFSCIERKSEGIGNISSDPLFVNAVEGDYHLQSERGRYWPMHDIWVLDEMTSPCIDAGNSVDDYSNEPEPNGGMINMGAYGGTRQASLSTSGFW